MLVDVQGSKYEKPIMPAHNCNLAQQEEGRWDG